MKRPIQLMLLSFSLITCSALAQSFVIPKEMSQIDRKRFELFETFQLRDVCGDRDLERLAACGVNTVRGYTIEEPAIMREKLNQAHRLSMKMIVIEWMPHHGDNKNKEGVI